MTFDDLDFDKTSHGIQAKPQFPNGYGASVVRNPHSYGGDRGLYELAVTDEAGLCYDSPITDDVAGFLSAAQVTRYLEQIESLPSKADELAQAAGPELLTALEKLLANADEIDGYDVEFGSVKARARKAIQKAKGTTK